MNHSTDTHPRWGYAGFLVSALAVLGLVVPRGMMQLSQQTANATTPIPAYVFANSFRLAAMGLAPSTKRSIDPSRTADLKAAIADGTAALEAGDYAKAQAEFSKALELQPDSIFGYHGRALSRLRMQQYEAAIADLTEVLDRSPDDVRAFANRGSAYHALGKTRNAMIDYNRAIALQPDYDIAFVNRGSLHFDLGNYEHALADFDRAIALNASDSKTLYNRAMVLAQLQQFDKAVLDLEVAEGLFQKQDQLEAAKLSRQAIDQIEAGTFDPMAPMP
ncbi:MAG: tetratricopeptide repeat protein [Coleofasciculaceae cyanobacterium RL_1_1]|nr:tetratricopeptide repeat protein [Coleofasciculaceae cyanobacterium RL_1_1]